MYKTQVIAKAAKESRMTQRDVNDAVTGVLKTIKEALKHWERVTFPGFGTFYTRHKAAGKVKHIRTRELITYPARQVAAFRPGQLLSRAVRGQGTTAKPAGKATGLKKLLLRGKGRG